MSRPASVVINLAALQSNFQRIRQLAPRQKIMAVVKADAYGHGLTRVAEVLTDADAFGVACLEEAGQLREASIQQPVVLLEGPFATDELAQIQQLQLDMVIHHAGQFAMLEAAAPGKPINVWLKIDTGMHRLGFQLAEIPAAYARLQSLSVVADHIRLMTHLASANDPADPLTTTQLANFSLATQSLAGERTIANSAAVLGWPDSHGDWIRPGLLLYGVSPNPGSTGLQHGLQPVMTFRSQLISVKSLKRNDPVGYGASWRCPEDMLIGIVAAGYGDGYPRHAKSGTPVLVNGQRAALIGHASMDMLAVDLRNMPQAQPGDPVVLWGDGLAVEEIAEYADTIPYELLCGDRKRMPYHYKTG
ncbi:MAG: alanine racemase [Gammaproteobacteria bacterium]